MTEQCDVVIVGGGQAALAASYFLRRTGLRYVILDNGAQVGGAWVHGWDSLHLFSPASYSSLPGWPMPDTPDGSYPTRDEVLDYLRRYEARYTPPIRRPVTVERVERADEKFLTVRTNIGDFLSRAVIGATGTWSDPFIPDVAGHDVFGGTQIHSAHYRSAAPFAGRRVLVVGGGNSGAQILAEVSLVANATWVTLHDPAFLPDDVDGRVLFERASARVLGGADAMPAGGFGDIVMVPEPARLWMLLTTHLLFVVDHSLYTRSDEPLFGNWDIFLNVINIEAQVAVTEERLCSVLCGGEEEEIRHRDFKLTASLYVHVLRPLCWAGLLNEHRTGPGFSRRDFYTKTPL